MAWQNSYAIFAHPGRGAEEQQLGHELVEVSEQICREIVAILLAAQIASGSYG